jgi:predicted PurR-regulated permease PerM
VGIAAIVVPPVVRGANNLVDDLPGYVQDLQDWVNKNPKLKKFDEDYDITAKLQQEAGKLPSKAGTAATTLADIGVALVNSIFQGITIFILSIFMVGGAPRWRARVLAMVPDDRRERADHLFTNIANAIGSFIAGALAQAAIAGITTFIVLKILGVPFAAPLAVLTAFFDLIPLVGATIAAVVVGVVTVFNDFPTATIIWTIWAIVYQQLENTVIQPRIQSKAVNIPGFFILVSVLFGSALFGVVGALLAIPVAASLLITGQEYLIYRREIAEPAHDPPGPTAQPPPEASGPAPA